MPCLFHDGYGLQIPQNTKEITITPQGNVYVKVGNQTEQTQVGTLQLIKFQNPSGLSAIGHNLLVETPASGVPVPGIAGQDGYG